MLPDPPIQASPQPLIGRGLIALAALSAFAMLHHPVAHHAPGQSHAEAIARTASLTGAVHGALIAMLVSNLLLLGEFVHGRIHHGGIARAGFTLYLLGKVALSGAALVNGFAAPALASSAGEAPGLDAALALAWRLNQALAPAGSMGLALAMALWSFELAQREGLRRLLGAYGLLAGLGLPVTLASDWLQLDAPGMLATLLALMVWQAAVGVIALRG